MGAEPGEAHVALALPRGFDPAAARELVAGMEALAARHGVTIAGGDVIAAGSAHRDRLRDRLGGRRGRSSSAATARGPVTSSGSPASSAAPRPGCSCSTARRAVPEAASLIERHRRPEPQLAAGPRSPRAGASAMIDLSDGLATDARHLAERSGCMITIELDRLPIAPGVAAVAEAAGRDPLELAAGAGDDYELLVTAPPERERPSCEQAASDAGVPADAPRPR